MNDENEEPSREEHDRENSSEGDADEPEDKRADNAGPPNPFGTWTLIIEVIQKGGDAKALDGLRELFERYKPVILGYFKDPSRNSRPEKAEEYTQAFLESDFVKPWNKRHAGVAVLYASRDVRLIPLLATKLQRGRRRVDDFLWGALSEEVRDAVQKQHGKDVTDGLREGLVKDLNAILNGPLIYEAERFADVPLSVETLNLLGLKRNEFQTTWLNRSLLGDAYPSNLQKGIGFLYLAERREDQKFRTFLYKVLGCFIKDQTREENAESAGGKIAHDSADEMAESGGELGFDSTSKLGRGPDAKYAAHVLELALGGSERSKELEAHLRGLISQKEAAERLGISEVAFRQQYHRFRKTLGKRLWSEVARTVGPDKKEIMAEIQYLLSFFAK